MFSIVRLKNEKFPGIDTFRKANQKPLTQLINQFFQSGICPSHVKCAIIAQIFQNLGINLTKNLQTLCIFVNLKEICDHDSHNLFVEGLGFLKFSVFHQLLTSYPNEVKQCEKITDTLLFLKQ